MPQPSPLTALHTLEKLRLDFNPANRDTKRRCLAVLGRRRVRGPEQVLRLHEVLCFMRAYPDSAATLERVEELLDGFDGRGDLRAAANRLADTGIAGTGISFRFYWFTAQWLAGRCGRNLTIDWPEFEHAERLEDTLHLVLPYADTPSLDNLRQPVRGWLDQMRSSDETDATFLIRSFATTDATPFLREALYESYDIPLRIFPGPDTPARTTARYPRSRIHFQTGPLNTARPDLRLAVREAPHTVQSLPAARGQELIDLTREAMVTRSRDLYAFQHAEPRDVRMVRWPDGLEFACIGTIPLRRLLFETTYGFLTIKNGVPVGYVLLSTIFGCTEVAFNVFESFRGGDTAMILGRALATARYLFGSEGYSIDPYQLGGAGNEEGRESGAWWFYYKLGFRPKDPNVLRVLRKELAAMKRNPKHRSGPATLTLLADDFLYLTFTKRFERLVGSYSLGHLGLRISEYLADRFGGNRSEGIEVCAAEAARLLGVRSTRGWSRGERLAWERWSPLILTLPGVASWTPSDRRALVAVVRAKGGRRESDFVSALARHRKLRNTLVRLARDS